MDFTKAVAIFISGILAPSMVDTLMVVSPGLQTGINAVLVRINKCAWNDGVFDEGLDGLLLHIGKQIDHHLTAALHHPKDGWPFLLQCATSTFAFESASTSFASLALALPQAALYGRQSHRLRRTPPRLRASPWAFFYDPVTQLGRHLLHITAIAAPIRVQFAHSTHSVP